MEKITAKTIETLKTSLKLPSTTGKRILETEYPEEPSRIDIGLFPIISSLPIDSIILGGKK